MLAEICLQLLRQRDGVNIAASIESLDVAISTSSMTEVLSSSTLVLMAAMPLMHMPLKERQHHQIVHVVDIVLQYHPIMDDACFRRLFISLQKLVMTHGSSDDIKFFSYSGITHLLKHPSGSRVFNHPDMANSVAHCVSLILDDAVTTGLRIDVRRGALTCLETIVDCSDVLRVHSFLPGLLSTCAKLVLSKLTHHQITLAAIRTSTKALVRVMSSEAFLDPVIVENIGKFLSLSDCLRIHERTDIREAFFNTRLDLFKCLVDKQHVQLGGVVFESLLDIRNSSMRHELRSCLTDSGVSKKLFEQRFILLLKQFLTQIRTSDDVKRALLISTLAGYIAVVGKACVYIIDAHLQDVIHGLRYISTVTSLNSPNKFEFEHFRDTHLGESLQEFIRILISRLGERFIDSIWDDVRLDRSFISLVAITSSCSDAMDPSVRSSHLVECLNLLESNAGSPLECSLILYSIAHSLKHSKEAALLQPRMLRILELSAHEDATVAGSATRLLDQLVNIYSLRSTKDLLQASVDQILNSITFRLHYGGSELVSGAFRVLSAILSHCGTGTTVKLAGSLELILDHLNNAIDARDEVSLTNILSALIQLFSMYKVDEQVDVAAKRRLSIPVEQLLARLSDSVQEAPDEAQEQKVSDYLIVRILGNVSVLLTTDSSIARIYAIRLACRGIVCEDLLLPDVVSFFDEWWGCLMRILKDDCLSCRLAVLDLLSSFVLRVRTLATRRVQADIIPWANSLLINSESNDSAAKLKSAALKSLEIILRNCDLGLETQHDLILRIMDAEISTQVVRETYKTLIYMDRDLLAHMILAQKPRINQTMFSHILHPKVLSDKNDESVDEKHREYSAPRLRCVDVD